MNRAELEQTLLEEGFPGDSFSVDGRWFEDAIVLRVVDGEWHMKDIDKGHATELGRYSDEESACDAMYEVVHDSWPVKMPRKRTT